MQPRKTSTKKTSAKRTNSSSPASLGALATYAVPKDPWGFDQGLQFVDPVVAIKRGKTIVELELHATPGSTLRGTPRVKRIEEVFASIAKAPLASQLEALSLGNLSDDGKELVFTRVIDGLRKLVPKLPALRRLRIGKHRHWSYDRLGDIEPLWRVIERLDALEIYAGAFDVGRIVASNLRSLCLYAAHGRTDEILSAVAAASFPVLEELRIRAGGDEAAPFTAFLAATKTFPRVRHLRLFNFSDKWAPLLATSPLLPQLATLDLSATPITTAGVQVLARQAKRFAHLETISFASCMIDKRGVEAAKKLGKGVIASDELYRQASRSKY